MRIRVAITIPQEIIDTLGRPDITEIDSVIKRYYGERLEKLIEENLRTLKIQATGALIGDIQPEGHAEYERAHSSARNFLKAAGAIEHITVQAGGSTRGNQ